MSLNLLSEYQCRVPENKKRKKNRKDRAEYQTTTIRQPKNKLSK